MGHMKYKIDRVRSFGRCAQGTSRVYFPTTPEEILDVFGVAKGPPRCRVAIRGGGHSFDDQAVHHKDDGSNIILSARCLQPDLIEFDPGGNKDRVRLGAGVTWGDFVTKAIGRSIERGEPIRLPGSIQTGRQTTVGGSLAGNTLSRFSGT